MKFETIKGGKDMNNKPNKEEEIKELERRKRVNDGLKLLAVVGIGAGLYGFKLGRRSGYRLGVGVGHTRAVNDMVSAWKDHTEELITLRSRGN